MGFFLKVVKRDLIDLMGVTKLCGQLNLIFLRPFFIKSISTYFLSDSVLQLMLMFDNFGLSLFRYEVIVGLTKPRAMLVELECTKLCAVRPEKSLSWVLQSVIVDAHDFRLTIVSFLALRSSVLLMLFSAVSLSVRRDSIFELSLWFSAARS